MRITGFPKSGLILAAAIVAAISVTGAFAQDNSAPAPTPQFHDITPPDNSAAPPAPPASPDTTTIATPAPMTPGDSTGLSPAAQQVLQLEQAKVSDSTIITFVQNSGSLYGLSASQIVYLKQQGVSDGVINAMLNQRTVLASSTPMQSAPPDNSAMTAPVTTVEQPTTPAPSTVYVVPDTQTYDYDTWAYPYYYPYYGYYSYPYYGYYGWPGYWGGGWGYRGGFHGGFHGGGGGFHGGFGGGGFHGGGGGGFHGGGGGGHR